MAKNYYVVLNGWRPGIYSSWYGPDGAFAASAGHSGEYHKGFDSIGQAKAFYEQHKDGVPFDRQWYQISALDLAEKLDEIISQPFEEITLTAHIASDGQKNDSKKQSSHRGLPIDTQDIGRWGEEFAFYYLITYYLENIPNSRIEIQEPYSDILVENTIHHRIHWKNKEQESNDSPDILDKGIDNTLFFEVKTTLREDLSDFSFTPAEWELAKELGIRYIILRVTGAGTLQAKIFRFENPYQLWLDGTLMIPEIGLPPTKPIITQRRSAPNESTSKNPPITQATYFEGVGRRKETTARVRIYPGTNSAFEINGKEAARFLTRIGDLERATKPLTISEDGDHLKISVVVRGGGVNGWVEAIQLGLARALLLYQPELRKAFRNANLLTRDARVKERKKPGLKRARKAPTYTKR